MRFVNFFAALIDLSPLPNTPADTNRVQIILSLVFGIAGAIALIIITLAGFKLVVSRGDPQAVVNARNALIYAVVGLVVSISAFTIINFVINNLF